MIEEKYKNIPVKLKSYYKHSFTFVDSDSEVKVYALVGGDADSIYNLSIDASREYKLGDLHHLEYVKITDCGKVIYEAGFY